MSVITPALTNPALQPRLSDVVRSEATKLRSLTSTVWSVLATAGMAVGTAGLVAQSPNVEPGSTLDATTTMSVSVAGFMFGQVAICVVGALAITGEYARDAIRTSLVAVPGRGRLLVGKAIAVAGLALVAGIVIGAMSYAVACVVMANRSVTLPGFEAGTARAMLGAGLYLALLSLFSLGIGVIVRHSAGAITAAISIVLILPNVLPALGSIGRFLYDWWPPLAGQQVLRVSTGPDEFTPWGGFGYFSAVTLVLLGAAYVVLRKRDA
jgi:ABC-2 type transport system permease protein